MRPLNVTIVQADLAWHDPDRNLERFSGMIAGVQETDLIVLPETFTTGFTMDAEAHAENMDGRGVAWMRETAKTAQASICGSLIIEDQGRFYNRFVCVSPEGATVHYDKRHLFRLAGEQHHYSPGKDFVTFEIAGWRICPMVCYDLRFPVWSRNRGRYDLLLYVANWPSPRHHAWETLLRARAIENQAYVAAVNRVGKDGNNIAYSGGSAIIDYVGGDLCNLHDRAGTASASLDPAMLGKFRDRFAFHLDADDFTLQLDDA